MSIVQVAFVNPLLNELRMYVCMYESALTEAGAFPQSHSMYVCMHL